MPDYINAFMAAQMIGDERKRSEIKAKVKLAPVKRAIEEEQEVTAVSSHGNDTTKTDGEQDHSTITDDTETPRHKMNWHSVMLLSKSSRRLMGYEFTNKSRLTTNVVDQFTDRAKPDLEALADPLVLTEDEKTAFGKLLMEGFLRYAVVVSLNEIYCHVK